MHRAGLESMLGLQLRGNELLVAPCLPAHWTQAEVRLRHGSALYVVAFENPSSGTNVVAKIEVDGQFLPAGVQHVPLLDDGAVHAVRVRLAGPALAAPDRQQSQ
jgi:cyclic beta-1,2-glucan synthetase